MAVKVRGCRNKSRKGLASRCPPQSGCQGACFALSFGQALEADEYTYCSLCLPKFPVRHENERNSMDQSQVIGEIRSSGEGGGRTEEKDIWHGCVRGLRSS